MLFAPGFYDYVPDRGPHNACIRLFAYVHAFNALAEGGALRMCVLQVPDYVPDYVPGRAQFWGE